MTDNRLGAEAEAGMSVKYAPSDVDAERAGWGSNKDPVGLLDPATTYKIDRVEVHSWHTKLWLEEVGGPFNSTHFVAAETGELS